MIYTLGASHDFLHATETARKMVTSYGMSDKIGLQYRFNVDESEQGKFNITEEIDSILKQSHIRAKAILNEHREELEIISRALMLKKTLYAEEIELLIEDYHSKLVDQTKKSVSGTKDTSSN